MVAILTGSWLHQEYHRVWFILYINDLQNVVSHSTLKIFADDVALYREIKSYADCSLLQQDLDNIYSSSSYIWMLKFMHKIHSVTILWESIVKYLGVYIQSNLFWFHHCRVVSAKAGNHWTTCITVYGNCHSCKFVAYKSLIRPLMSMLVKCGVRTLLETYLA